MSGEPSWPSERLDARLVVFLTGVAALFFVAAHDMNSPNYYLPGVTLVDDLNLSLQAIGQGHLRRRISFVLLGMLGAAMLLRERRRDVELHRVVVTCAALFLLWSTISLVWAEDPLLTLRRVTVLWLLVITAAGVAVATPRVVLPSFIAASSAAYLLIGFGNELALGTFRPLVDGYRFAGTLHPNIQGINCAMVGLSGLWLLTRSTGRTKVVAWSLVGASLVFLVLTRSRTAFASFVVAASLIPILQLRPNRQVVVSAFLVNLGILALLLYWQGLLDPLLNLMLLGRDPHDVSTLNSRLPLWTLLADYAAERPILGYGYSGFMTEQHAIEIAVLQRFGVAGAHSIYLEITLGVGLVGLLLMLSVFLTGIAAGVRDGERAQRGPASLFVAILAFELLNGILDSSMISPSWRLLPLVVLACLCLLPAGRHPSARFRPR